MVENPWLTCSITLKPLPGNTPGLRNLLRAKQSGHLFLDRSFWLKLSNKSYPNFSTGGSTCNRREEVKKMKCRASLVAQWWVVCLPMQGTRVRALVGEDLTCRRAADPMCHSYWACALEPVSHNYWSPRAWSPCSATREATAMRNPRTATKSSTSSPQLENIPRTATKTQGSKNK